MTQGVALPAHLSGRRQRVQAPLTGIGQGKESVLHAQTSRCSRDCRSHGVAFYAEERTGRGSSPPSAFRHESYRTAGKLHALLPDIFDHRLAVTLARYAGDLAMGARLLEGRLSGRAGQCSGSHLLPILVWTVSRILVRVRSRMPDWCALHSGRRDVQYDASRHDRECSSDSALLHPDVCLVAGGGCRKGVARTFRQQCARLDCRRRTRWKYSCYARPDRTGVGSASYRSSRSDGNRSAKLRMLGKPRRSSLE